MRTTRFFLSALAAMVLSFAVAAQTSPWFEYSAYSPDTAAVFAAMLVRSEAVAEVDLAGNVSEVDIGAIPNSVNVNGFHRLPNDDRLLTFDTTIVLDGMTIEPRDIVLFDGTNFSRFFDGSDEGIPNGAVVDALSLVGGLIYLSFDTTVAFDSFIAQDEDIVFYSTVGDEFGEFFVGAEFGVPPGLDLDAFHFLEAGVLLVSFDTSGAYSGLIFDDEDVLELNPGPGAWTIAYDGSEAQDGWSAADLDAFFAVGLDSDQDGRSDINDNCIAFANQSQRDSDGDGFGNLCDADLNGDCIVNGSDLGLFRLAYLSNDPESDFNGDGVVNVVDLGILRLLFFAPPGPSGRPNDCSGSVAGRAKATDAAFAHH